MITQLYIERVADGFYDVVCNDMVTTAPAGDIVFGAFLGIAYGIESAIEVLTEPHYDECEYLGDITGVRYGFMPFDMIGVMYGDEYRIVPADERERVARQLIAAVEK